MNLEKTNIDTASHTEQEPSPKLLTRIKEHVKMHGYPTTEKQVFFLKKLQQRHLELKNNILFHALIGSGIDPKQADSVNCMDPHGVIAYYLDNFETQYKEEDIINNEVNHFQKAIAKLGI